MPIQRLVRHLLHLSVALRHRRVVRGPGAGGIVVRPVVGHGAAHRCLARWLPLHPLPYQAAHPEAPSARVLLLDLQHIVKEGEGELHGRVGCRARAPVFQAGEFVALEGLNDRPDMLGREFEHAGDAALVPPFVVQPHDRPAGLVGILELMERRPRQG